MKCPVCGTRADNTNVCPNCGMTLKKEKIVEDVKPTTIKKPEYFGKDVSTGKKISRVIRLVIIMTVIAAVVIFAGVPMFKEMGDAYSYKKIASMSFKQVIDEGYDTKDTVKNLIAHRDAFIDDYVKQGYEIRYISDSCYQERSSKPLVASSHFEVVIEDGYHYADVTFTFQEGELYSTKLDFNGGGTGAKQFDVERIEVDTVSHKLNMSDAYDQLRAAYNLLEEVEDGKYVFDNVLNGYNIYIELENWYLSQKYYMGYHSSYSIEKVWVN